MASAGAPLFSSSIGLSCGAVPVSAMAVMLFLSLRVSGKQKRMRMKMTNPTIARNHCTARHPKASFNAPPTMGESRGPHNGPR